MGTIEFPQIVSTLDGAYIEALREISRVASGCGQRERAREGAGEM